MVISNNNRSLIGRNFMTEFNIVIHSLINVNNRKLKLNKLLNEYKKIFSERIGTYSFEKINLRIKPNLSPAFTKPSILLKVLNSFSSFKIKV